MSTLTPEEIAQRIAETQAIYDQYGGAAYLNLINFYENMLPTEPAPAPAPAPVAAPAPSPVSAPAPAPSVSAADSYSVPSYDDLVLQAYESIGRTGFGDSNSTIDQPGYDFWVSQLQSGAITPAQFDEAFYGGVNADMTRDLGYADYINAWNTSLEGQNQDTEAITAYYRDLFGRNPEQEGYQYWKSMAQTNPLLGTTALREALIGGAQNSDTALAGGFSSANVPALEADPFAGRYATRSIYDLIDDAVNVSSINDRPVQFVTPVGQMPVVSSFNNGSFTATPGVYTLNPAQASAQMGTALDSGALTAEQYQQMIKALEGAKTVDEIRSVFNSPTATVNLGTGGTQTGVNGQNINFDPIIADNYAGVDTGTTSAHVINDANAQQKLPGVTSSITNQLQKVNPKFNILPSNRLQNLGTFGATRGTMMDSGDADYQSNLIKSLRDATGEFSNYNTGVNMWGVDPSTTMQAIGPAGNTSGMAFNPQPFNQRIASNQDIASRQSYDAYRSGMVGKGPVLSFADWLSQPVPDAVAPSVSETYVQP